MKIHLEHQGKYWTAAVTSIGATQTFDNKHGSWQTRGKGRRHDASPYIAKLIQTAVKKEERRRKRARTDVAA